MAYFTKKFKFHFFFSIQINFFDLTENMEMFHGIHK